MLDKRIYLIGMPGCGKSTLGKRLANELGYEFIDMDLYIEKTSGKSIEDIFNDYGEAWFRAYERKTLEEFARLDNVVIGTGGGVIKDKTNKELMDGKCIYLRVPCNVLQARCDASGIVRPILKTRTIAEIFEERKDLYNFFKDIEIENIDLEAAISILSDVSMESNGD